MNATILQFPNRNKGRVRKSTGINAAGEMAMRGLRTAPANVECINDHRQSEADHGHLALMFAATMFATLPSESKATLRNQLEAIGQTDLRAREILHIIGRGA